KLRWLRLGAGSARMMGKGTDRAGRWCGGGRGEVLELVVGEVEGVAGVGFAGFESFGEPSGALFGGSVGEGFGDGVALGLALEAVVADGGGGAEGFVDVAGFEDVPVLLGVVGP